MSRTIFAKSVARRSILAGVGAGVAGMLLRPLQAQEASGSPTRLLIVHRPCGTVLDEFFPPAGDARNFQLPKIISSFAPLKDQMIIANGINCPRDTAWPADQHAAGLIAMMSGKKFASIKNTDASGDPNAKNIIASDKTIDQHLLATVTNLQVPGAKLASIQSTAYGPSAAGLPSFKVMSYAGGTDALNGALFPLADAQSLFNTLFVDENAGLTPEQLARKLAQGKSVLDRVNADLARMQSLVPASQRPKLDAHLTGVRALEKSLQGTGSTMGKECKPPTLKALPSVPDGLTADEARHLTVAQNQLAIIQTAFQCDLTRVATFSFAHGNSDLRFQKIDPATVSKGDGHHGLSHDTGAGAAQSRIDQIYCEQLSTFLQGMKATPDGTGSLLDNTLVVFFNECAIGNTHSIENMPVLLFGGKSLGLQTGQHLQFGGRYMNDVWAAICGAFGAPAAFGDPAFTRGPVSGLFA